MYVLNLPGVNGKRIRVACENKGDMLLAWHILLTYRDNPDTITGIMV